MGPLKSCMHLLGERNWNYGGQRHYGEEEGEEGQVLCEQMERTEY